MRTLQEEFSHIEIGRSSEFRNLTLFPLTRQSEPVPEMDYLLLEDGIAQGKVRVTELHAGGSVPELRLENNADLPVLLVDGEELVGAKQNRVLNLTILAPANHTKGYDSRLAATDSSRMDVVQIAGVAADSRQIASRRVHDLYDPASPEIFVPLLQHPEDGRDLALLLKTSTEPGTLAEAVRAQVLGLNPDQPVYDTRTLQKIADVALGPARLCLLLLAIFARTALLTACVGLFAIVCYTVTQRTHEIGIRMALGARRRDVLRIVVNEGMLVVAAGLLVGFVASLGVTRLMSTLLYRVASNDASTLVAVSVILTAVAMLASVVPVRRATKVDPMVALRYE